MIHLFHPLLFVMLNGSFDSSEATLGKNLGLLGGSPVLCLILAFSCSPGIILVVSLPFLMDLRRLATAGRGFINEV